MKELIIMSAGPTSVHREVLEAARCPLKNTDLDSDYVAFQRETEKKISRLLQTDSRSFIMLGEAMLGLDGALASFIEPGDRVLVIENGVFGGGFHSMAQAYGAETVAFKQDPRHGIDTQELDAFLQKNADFKLATFIHCETPTGVTNDVHAIGQVLNKHHILSICDAVSGLGGEPFRFDESKVDVVIDGILSAMQEKGYMLSGAMAELAGKAFRIGHMGNNIADPEEYDKMLAALKDVLA